MTIARRAGLPRTLLTLIEGEGLLNDATALTVYQVAVAAAVGNGFSVLDGVGRFPARSPSRGTTPRTLSAKLLDHRLEP